MTVRRRTTTSTAAAGLLAVALTLAGAATLGAPANSQPATTTPTAAAAADGRDAARAGTAERRRPSIKELSPPVDSVTGGAQVTISGTGYRGKIKVKFGKTRAQAVRVSATQLHATVPAAAPGQTHVRVIAGGKRSKRTKASAFTYRPPVRWRAFDDGTGGDPCAIRADGSAWCSGFHNTATADFGGTYPPQEWLRVRGGTNWRAITADSYIACGIKKAGSLWCWGDPRPDGSLGDGTHRPSGVPVRIGDATWSSVSATQTGACGIQTDGTGWCWGGYYDALGYGGYSARPKRISGGGTWTQITTGYQTACGIRPDRSAWCWGDGSSGQLGNADYADVSFPNATEPVRVGDPEATWASISTGSDHACGVQTDGTGWCWGNGSAGQRGDGQNHANTNGNAYEQHTPVPNRYKPGGWSHIVADGDTSCGLQTDHTLWCWGDNGGYSLGIAGRDSDDDSLEPLQLAGTDWAQLVRGNCALRTDGTAWCWEWQANRLGHSGYTVFDHPYEVIPALR